MGRPKKVTAVAAIDTDVMFSPEAVSTGETVAVGCKLPWGLTLRGERKASRSVPVLGGGAREENYYEPDGRRVTIYGNSRAIGEDAKTRIVAGVAITDGIPKDLWEAWFESNKNQPMIRNGLVFARKTVEEVVTAAKLVSVVRSGLEPLAHKNDPRQPRPTRPEIKGIEFDAESGKNTKFADVE